jgi:hypothetical protein
MTFSKQTAEIYYQQLDEFVSELMPGGVNLLVECEAQTAINSPSLCINFNDDVVYARQLTDGVHIIELSLIPKTTIGQRLSISMQGKTPRDTIVEHGKIIKDTSIKLLKLNINNYSLLDDYDFFNQRFSYIDENRIAQTPMSGFWSNSHLELAFDHPFDFWYNSTSKKNASISSMMRHRAADNLDELISNLETSLKKLT